MKRIIYAFILSLLMIFTASAQHNRVDGLRPDAPELAKPGQYKIGVRTLQLSNKHQIDAVNIIEGEDFSYYDRPLTIEVWYPADTEISGGEYKNVPIRDGKTMISLYGAAVRDASPLKNSYPLIIISHGYPGDRLLMSHFAENLATKGYVVASIDHTDSMYQDAGPFPSTLLNRPKDQKFVLDEMTRFNNEQNHFLQGIVDTSRTGLIGYSMGGYGAMITAGAGITKAVAQNKEASPNQVLTRVMAGSNEHKAMMDERFKAILAVSPWGMARDFWDMDGLKNITKPMFFISGGVDDVSGYEKGTKKLYQSVINTDRYLLTFENGNHNSAAPIPAPVEAWTATYNDGNSNASSHYTDPVWDTLRMNNIAQHFATAYFDKIIKGDQSMNSYLDLVPNSNLSEGETQWKGFPPRTAKGLKLEYLAKQ